MPSLNFTSPKTVDEAVKILAGASGMAKVLAGGTDLLVQLRSGRVKPELIVDTKKIPELIGIREESDHFVIGASTPGVMIYEHEALTHAWPGIVEGLDLIGSEQIQGRASLAKGEFIVEFHVAKPKPHQSDAYLRFIPRTEMDIAVVGVGVNVTLDGNGVCTDARVVLGAVAPTQVIAEEAGAALIGHRLDDDTLSKLDAAAGRACKPINDKRGTIEYRIKVAGVLARRAAAIAFERAAKR